MVYLVKVGLEEVDLLGVLEQPGPVGVVQLLLSQYHLDVLRRVVDLALRRVDLAVELELHMVGLLQGV